MAYINRLSDINNKLDTNIENQTETNTKLANIDDNIETIRTSFDVSNNALKVNIVAGGSSTDNKAYLYNGAGDTSITASTVDTDKKGIDTASSLYVTTSGTRTALSKTDLLDSATSTNKYGLDTSSSIYGVNGTTRQHIGYSYVSTDTHYGLNTASSMYVSSGTGIRRALTATTIDTNKDGLDTASSLYVTTGGTRTALTATSNALDVNIKSETINRQGELYNILNGSLNANEYSTSVDITGYNNCILSYQDTQNLTDAILIFGSIDDSNFFYIGVILPLYYASFKGGAKRFASTKLNLASIKYIQIYNSSSTNITDGKCTLVSG